MLGRKNGLFSKMPTAEQCNQGMRCDNSEKTQSPELTGLCEPVNNALAAGKLGDI